jgi:ATP-dependent DNA helicase RecG
MGSPFFMPFEEISVILQAMAYDFFENPVEYVKGVGPRKAEMLKKELNIFTFGDLLHFYPFRYVDRSKFYKASEVSEDMPYVQLRGKISNVQSVGGKRTIRMTAQFRDDTGTVELVWFNGFQWIREKLESAKEFIVFGKPGVFNRTITIAHPDLEDAALAERTPVNASLQPYYSSTEKLKSVGLDSKGFERVMKNLVISARSSIPEILPAPMIAQLNLVSRETALLRIHFPENNDNLQAALRRLKFDEFFFIQLKLLQLKFIRLQKPDGFTFEKVGEVFNTFYHQLLKFELTGAQKRVVKEIRKDMGSGNQMNRLLQGDVGSGKTLVALLSMLIAIDNGYQTCIMAPTEILAAQHFASIGRFVEGLGLKIALLTGSTKKAERRVMHEALRKGEIHILIGTHALIEDEVQFMKLGLVVIDEQHRFGVAQRARLWEKSPGTPPHVLVMTATPIPRTLAMTLYGDLEVSVIDELPPGRRPVKTYLFSDSARLKVFDFMKKMITEGRQVFVVYPLIKESETLDLKDLMDGYDSICRAFPPPEYAVSIVHGKMKPAEKDYEMQRFVKGETHIMVATTVIEVGVDIPNASVMVIENAERFGLSQLHQLRGRVGRGAAQSFCLLMAGQKLSSDGKVRLKTMVETNDGFRIAETDLKLRGPGDIQGLQQSGIVDLRLADIVKDEQILLFAREFAIKVLSADPELSHPENRPLADHLRRVRRQQGDWGHVS